MTPTDPNSSKSNGGLDGAAEQAHAPRFSFVVPVHNTARYLDAALQSLVNQSIGFVENIEVVLVDDGSTDESLDVCRQWSERYPRNIVVITQAAAGVSAARNRGFAASRGEWINFMDSDDTWSFDICEDVARFVNEHPSACVVAARHEFFGAYKGPHPLAHQYHVERQIVLDSQATEFLVSVNNVFIKRNYIPIFDEGLSVGEDLKAALETLMVVRAFGVLAQPAYHYRRRDDGSSALSRADTDRTYYLDTPVRAHRALIEKARAEDGSIPLFLQHALMYDLQWRLKNPNPEILSKEESAAYRALLAQILREIDVRVIVAQRNLSVPRKFATVAMRLGLPVIAVRKPRILQG